MGAKRSFDWDEARRLRATGLTYTEIGKRLGVSGQCVGLACDDERRERQRQRMREAFAATCLECGGPCVTNYYNKNAKQRCHDCASKAKTKIRAGQAYCPKCGEWKAIEEFSPSKRRRLRGVHGECRRCDTARRRTNRHENQERERAWDRQRRQRAAA